MSEFCNRHQLILALSLEPRKLFDDENESQTIPKMNLVKEIKISQFCSLVVWAKDNKEY